MCTNFNFSYNQEGGYDCTIKIIALGALADSTKLNQTQAFPTLYSNVIKSFVNTLQKIEKERLDKIAAEEKAKISAQNKSASSVKKGDIVEINKSISQTFTEQYPKIYKTNIDNGIILSSNSDDKNQGAFVFSEDSTIPTSTKDFRGVGGGI